MCDIIKAIQLEIKVKCYYEAIYTSVYRSLDSWTQEFVNKLYHILEIADTKNYDFCIFAGGLMVQ